VGKSRQGRVKAKRMGRVYFAESTFADASQEDKVKEVDITIKINDLGENDERGKREVGEE
jgi:hypothetical protein